MRIGCIIIFRLPKLCQSQVLQQSVHELTRGCKMGGPGYWGGPAMGSCGKLANGVPLFNCWIWSSNEVWQQTELTSVQYISCYCKLGRTHPTLVDSLLALRGVSFPFAGHLLQFMCCWECRDSVEWRQEKKKVQPIKPPRDENMKSPKILTEGLFIWARWPISRKNSGLARFHMNIYRKFHKGNSGSTGFI